ncbi:MAG: acyltransferase [Capsulimonas sp.]|uniref:acyltransferase n=1 Tax=Capsulimonas sp. TaxID=2494211 RepID=UPI0032641E09
MKLNWHTLEKVGEVAWAKYSLRRCTQVGKRIRVAGQVQVHNRGRIVIGDKVTIRATHVPVELAAGSSAELIIGDRTYINAGVSIGASVSVRIGKDCAIGNYTLIMDNDFHSVENHKVSPEGRPVVIEDGVWLAARVTVLKGVTIGQGAVVAAGAVVTKDVAPRTLVGGVPARFIRSIDKAPETS